MHLLPIPTQIPTQIPARTRAQSTLQVPALTRVSSSTRSKRIITTTTTTATQRSRNALAPVQQAQVHVERPLIYKAANVNDKVLAPAAPKMPAERKHRSQIPPLARPNALSLNKTMAVSMPVRQGPIRSALAPSHAGPKPKGSSGLKPHPGPIIPAVPTFDATVYLDTAMEVEAAAIKDDDSRHATVHHTNMDPPMDLEENDADPTLLSEYQAEIFAYKKQMEIKLMPDPHYMNMQTDLTWQYRVRLIEWLIQVHERFDLLQETIHLCVNYLDRFLSKVLIPIDHLQLAGTVALLLASKFEEIQSPAIEALVLLGGNAYTPSRVRQAEIEMLRVLDYDMSAPGPMSFLRRISKADRYDVDIRTLAKYLVDLTLCDHRFIAVPSSMVAAVGYCASMRLLFRGQWTAAHELLSGYAQSTLVGPMNVLLAMLEQPMESLFAKYQHERYMHASDYVQGLGVTVLRSLHA
ncbi:hypothetical protein BGX28_005993 [Mortierella sp. GBA30]|nr:hypothetical protein BGX28_005993 [Mortierella sp. GBA30]